MRKFTFISFLLIVFSIQLHAAFDCDDYAIDNFDFEQTPAPPSNECFGHSEAIFTWDIENLTSDDMLMTVLLEFPSFFIFETSDGFLFDGSAGGSSGGTTVWNSFADLDPNEVRTVSVTVYYDPLQYAAADVPNFNVTLGTKLNANGLNCPDVVFPITQPTNFNTFQNIFPGFNDVVSAFPVFNSGTIDGNWNLDGTLTVDQSLTLDGSINRGQFSISDGGRIIVESGATLTIDNYLMTSCDGGLWNSIIVKGGGTLIIRNNSILEFASHSVTLRANATFESDGTTYQHCGTGVRVLGNITLTSFADNKLENNHRGMIIRNTINPLTIVDTNEYTNNDIGIYCFQNANAEISSQQFNENRIGINASNCGIIDVQSSTFSSTAPFPFATVDADIRYTRSGGTVSNNNVFNSGTEVANISILNQSDVTVNNNNEFKSYGRGIWSRNSHCIIDHNFFNMEYHIKGIIRVENYTGCVVNNNVFDLNSGSVGIDFSNMSGSSIEYNEFKETAFGAANYGSTAIRVDYGEGNTVLCNDIQGEYEYGISNFETEGNTLSSNKLGVNLGIGMILREGATSLDIRANTFFGDHSMWILDNIGVQELRGNCFATGSLVSSDAGIFPLFEYNDMITPVIDCHFTTNQYPPNQGLFKAKPGSSFEDECGITSPPGELMRSRSEEKVIDSKLSVYPNPTTENYTIDLTNLSFGKAEITVRSLNGQIIESKMISSDDSQIVDFASEQYEAGMYLIIVATETQQFTEKLIIVE